MAWFVEGIPAAIDVWKVNSQMLSFACVMSEI
jgi:hypothetical protein